MDVKTESARRAPAAGELTPAERAAVIEVARAAGSLATRGPAAGEPSITVLLRDIASGDLVVLRKVRKRRKARSTMAAQIEEWKRARPDMSAREVSERVGCKVQTVYAVWSRAGRREKSAGDATG